MSRKQKKKDAREQSTRQLMGIDVITDYGIATRMHLFKSSITRMALPL